MWSPWKDLDRILRGEATRVSTLRDEKLDIPIFGLTLVILVLAVIYGACMGTFGIFSADEPRYHQLLASTLKVPALFFLTLLITFPSLYVFNTLVGSRLRLPAVLRLLIASLGVNLAVLSSLGPIVAFFSVNTTSHPFMILLNVLVFASAGVLGMMFLFRTLHRLSVALRERADICSQASSSDSAMEGGPAQEVTAQEVTAQEVTGQEEDSLTEVSDAGTSGAGAEEEAIWAELAEDTSALDRLEGHVLGRHIKVVFACWTVIFGLVGAQMSWVLRPFIGSPDEPFVWFCQRESNFFEAVWQAAQDLLF